MRSSAHGPRIRRPQGIRNRAGQNSGCSDAVCAMWMATTFSPISPASTTKDTAASCAPDIDASASRSSTASTARARGGGPIGLHVRVPEDETVPSATSPSTRAPICRSGKSTICTAMKFDGHPNLRRILLWDGFNGHPMRKDWQEAYYEEEVKPFRSRHPKGEYAFHEDKLPWAKNTTYPSRLGPRLLGAARRLCAGQPGATARAQAPSGYGEHCGQSGTPSSRARTVYSACSRVWKARRFSRWSPKWATCTATMKRLVNATPG